MTPPQKLVLLATLVLASCAVTRKRYEQREETRTVTNLRFVVDLAPTVGRPELRLTSRANVHHKFEERRVRETLSDGEVIATEPLSEWRTAERRRDEHIACSVTLLVGDKPAPPGSIKSNKHEIRVDVVKALDGAKPGDVELVVRATADDQSCEHRQRVPAVMRRNLQTAAALRTAIASEGESGERLYHLTKLCEKKGSEDYDIGIRNAFRLLQGKYHRNIYVAYGNTLVRQNPLRAADLWTKVCQKSQDQKAGFSALGIYQTRRPSQATELMAYMREAFPDDATVVVRHARMLSSGSSDADAILELRMFMHEHPTKKDPAQKHFDELHARLERDLSSNPTAADSARRERIAERTEREYKIASRLRKESERNPNNPAKRRQYDAAYKKAEKSNSEFLALRSKAKRVNQTYVKAQQAWKAMRYADCIQECDALLKADRRYGVARHLKALAVHNRAFDHYEAERFEKALPGLLEAFRLDPREHGKRDGKLVPLAMRLVVSDAYWKLGLAKPRQSTERKSLWRQAYRYAPERVDQHSVETGIAPDGSTSQTAPK